MGVQVLCSIGVVPLAKSKERPEKSYLSAAVVSVGTRVVRLKSASHKKHASYAAFIAEERWAKMIIRTG